MSISKGGFSLIANCLNPLSYKEVGKGREARMRHDSTHLPDSNIWWSLNMRCTYLHLVHKISWEISQRFFPPLQSLLICINSNLCWQGDCLECLPSDADTSPFPDPSVPWTCAAWVVAAPSIKMLHYKYHVSKKRRFPSHCKWQIGALNPQMPVQYDKFHLTMVLIMKFQVFNSVLPKKKKSLQFGWSMVPGQYHEISKKWIIESIHNWFYFFSQRLPHWPWSCHTMSRTKKTHKK